MTRSEDERLAVVETEVAHLRLDTTEIKSDVKEIAAALRAIQVQAAVSEVLDVKHRHNQAILRDRLRTLGPWVIGALGLMVGLVK